MPIRCALFAILLAATAGPAQAQSYDPGPPPPLPDLSDDAWDRGDYDAGEADEWFSDPVAPPVSAQPMVFAPEHRAAWLEQCRALYDERGEIVGDRLAECETYLSRFEQAYAGPGAEAYGYSSGPVMWIRVPIARSRAECACEHVVVGNEPASHAAPRPAARKSDKRVRIAR